MYIQLYPPISLSLPIANHTWIFADFLVYFAKIHILKCILWLLYTWRIIPLRKWLITLVSISPRFVGYLIYKWMNYTMATTQSNTIKSPLGNPSPITVYTDDFIPKNTIVAIDDENPNSES